MYKLNVRASSPNVRKRTEDAPRKILDPELTNIPIPSAVPEPSTSWLLKQLEFSPETIKSFHKSRAHVKIIEKEKDNYLGVH